MADAHPPPASGEQLAIVAASYLDAVIEARERGLGRRQWIYVPDQHIVNGRNPGRYAVRSNGTGLPEPALRALALMHARGWQLAEDGR